MEYYTKFEYEDDEKPPVRVKVKTLLGKELKLKIKPNEKISELQKYVHKWFDITPEQQCLVYEGVILEENKSIKDYKMENGSLINLIVK